MKSDTYSGYYILDKRISLVNALFVIAALLMFIGWQYFRYNKFDNKPPVALSQTQETCPPPAVIKYNMTEYKYARPLLIVDVLGGGDVANNPLSGLESGINSIIETKKREGTLSDASVYVQQLNTGSFININNEERYHPASLLKVPVMMVYLRESEINHALLNREISSDGAQIAQRKQYFPPEDEIKQGVKYTVSDLIYRMIVNSDNNASYLLAQNMDKDRWARLFADLELPKPEMKNLEYTLSAAEYSRFMRILYNATYLSNEDADYALSLLTQTRFKQGLLKQLPPDVQVSHKFGEFGTNEMHESGIIYMNNNPILITIMTKGNDITRLPQVISDISKYVYDQMKAKGS